MHIKKTKSKNYEHYSIIYDVKINGKRTSKVYENIGNYDKLKLRAGNENPITWLNNYVKDLNKKSKEDTLPIIILLINQLLITKPNMMDFMPFVLI